MRRHSPLLTALVLLGLSFYAGTLFMGETERPSDAPGIDLVDPWEDEPGDEMGFDDPERLADEELEREELDEPAPAPLSGLVARVVDAAYSPVSGADVFCADWDEINRTRRERELPGSMHYADIGVLIGARRISGEDGRTVLPPVEDRSVVVARYQDTFGLAWIDPRRGADQKITVRLEPDQTLRILVRDAAGEARADVPVGTFQGTTPRSTRSTWTGTTDAAGIAEIRHFQLLSRRYGRSNSENQGPIQNLAAIRLPLASPAYASFETDPVPEEPIELTLPPMGAVDVAVVDDVGAPVRAAMQLTLTPVRTEPDLEAMSKVALPSWFDVLRVDKPAGEASVRFESLGLRLEFRAGARIDEELRWRGEPQPGPQTEAEVATITLPIPDWMSLISGRLIDGGDNPLASMHARFYVDAAGRRAEMEDIDTAPDGRFELALKHDESDNPPFTLEVETLRPRARMGARVPIHSDIPAGARVEVGDVRITDHERIAWGRIVDDRGRPIRRANVALQRWRLRGGENPRETWVTDQLIRARTDEEGNFELFGDPPPGRLRLSVSARMHVSATSSEFRRGQEVSLQLERTGRIDGNVLLPEWLPRSAVTVELTSPDSNDRERASLRQRKGEARLRFESVAPGRWDLRIKLANFPDPVFELLGLVVESGRNRPEQLQPLDLSTALYQFTIRALDANGQVPQRLGGAVIARVFQRDGQPEWTAFRWQKGEARIIHTQPTLDVWILAAGHAVDQRVVGQGLTDVLLRRLNPVQVTMPGLRGLVGNDRRVRVSLVLDGGTGLPESMRGTDQYSGSSFTLPRAWLAKSGGAWLPENLETCQIPLMRNGRYDVVARLYKPDSRRPRSVTLDTIDVVLDRPDVDRHTVKVDAAKVQRTLQKLLE